ncbi:thermonuclease family protein [Enterovibrio norvegicus]|uniref:thermonuclease family protein n=1 Tax=Enterovibrio norvegicus TaxID=188144 RepID=UPI00352EDFC8
MNKHWPLAVFTVLLLILPAHTYAKNQYGTATVTKVTSIYDADTFRVNIEGWPAIVGEHVPVRVKGVDAPEIRGKCKTEKHLARVAKQFTVEQLRTAKEIRLMNIERGKYFRLLADVEIDGQLLADKLIKAGIARPYQGGRRGTWCD